MARNVEIPRHPRHCQRSLQSTPLLPCGNVQEREVGGGHVARLLEQLLQEGENAVDGALSVVMRVFVRTGRSERDQSRQRLDSVHVADVQTPSIGAVHLRDENIGGKRALDDALSDAFVDRGQGLAPVTPRSEEIDENDWFGGDNALEILSAFDERADRFGLHDLLLAEIQIQLHWVLEKREKGNTGSYFARNTVFKNLPAPNILGYVDLWR